MDIVVGLDFFNVQCNFFPEIRLLLTTVRTVHASWTYFCILLTVLDKGSASFEMFITVTLRYENEM